MLIMTIVTWEPPQRDAVLKRFATQGAKLPAGAKTLGMWGDVHGGRLFQLVEWADVPDPKISVQISHLWTDLCKVEVVPVMNAEELMKVISGKK
jgi:hypothetical protein